MSAYLVDKAHIDALVTAGLTWQHYGPLSWVTRDLTEDEQQRGYAAGAPWGRDAVSIHRTIRRTLERGTADEVGRMLWLENLASVAHRYPDDTSGDRPGPIGLTDEQIEAYRFEPMGGTVQAVIVLKLLSCYEYQSCEHPSWHGSEAQRFCDALRKHMIDHLPGYDEAPWEATDRYVFPGSKPLSVLRKERSA